MISIRNSFFQAKKLPLTFLKSTGKNSLSFCLSEKCLYFTFINDILPLLILPLFILPLLMIFLSRLNSKLIVFPFWTEYYSFLNWILLHCFVVYTVSFFKFLFESKFKKLYFQITFQISCKNSTQFTNTFHPISPDVNNLYNQSTSIRNRKITLVQLP